MKRFAGLLLTILCCLPARAGYVPYATLYQIADKSDVLVAGEVLAVQSVPSDSSANPSDVKAKIRVLRSYPTELVTSPTIEVRYRNLMPTMQKDGRGGFFTFDARFFSAPNLQIGDRVVLPLDKPKEDGAWPFSIAEGENLLVPIATQIPDNTSNSRFDFLQNELAGALSNGDAKTLKRTVSFLFDTEFNSYGKAGAAPLDEIYRRAAAQIGDEKTRWLDIAVLGLENIGRIAPRSSINELRIVKKGPRPGIYSPLLTQALGKSTVASSTRVGEEELISALIAAKAHTVLAENYSKRASVLRYFENGLAQGQFVSMQRIMALLDNRARAVTSHPLIPVALLGARRALAEKRPAGKTPFYEAVTIIRKYGDQKDWQFYMSELRRAQTADLPRFKGLFQPVLWITDTRTRPVFALLLNDKRRVQPELDYRISDEATSAIQVTSRVELGWKNDTSIAERDKAVEKAKHWLKS